LGIDHWHLRVREREKNNVCTLRGFSCVQHFETTPPGPHPGLAARVQPDNNTDPAVPKIESVSAALRSEPDHRACFSLQPAKIDIFIGVNARGQI
jgi:hypothetical protein